jgi:hypothetical protein
VLAGLEHRLRQRRMRGDGRGQDDRVEARVLEQVGEVVGEARRREERRHALARRAVGVADPRQLAVLERVEVAGEVRPQ